MKNAAAFPGRLEGFAKRRPPKSLAELNSRIGSFSYFSQFIPDLKKIWAPLLSLAKAEKFTWGKLEAESFKNVKMLIQLDITNYHKTPRRYLKTRQLALRVHPNLHLHHVHKSYIAHAGFDTVEGHDQSLAAGKTV